MSNICFTYFCRFQSNRLKYLLYIPIFLVLASCKQNNSPLAKKDKVPSADTNYRKLSDVEKAMYSSRLEFMYDSLFARNFNGSMLVAKNGQVLLEQYKGYADLATKDTI